MVSDAIYGGLRCEPDDGSGSNVRRVVRSTRDLNECNGCGGRIGSCASFRIDAGGSPRDSNASSGVARREGVPGAFIWPERLHLVAPLLQQDVRPGSRHKPLYTGLDPGREHKGAKHSCPSLCGSAVAHEHTEGEHCAREHEQRRLIPHFAQGPKAAHDRMILVAGETCSNRNIGSLGL